MKTQHIITAKELAITAKAFGISTLVLLALTGLASWLFHVL